MKVPISSPKVGPPSHGIIDSITPTTGPEQWESGVEFVPDTAIAGLSAEPVCAEAIDTPTIEDCVDGVSIEPFVVSATVRRPIRTFAEGDLESLAADALARSESALIESAVAYGVGTLTMQTLDAATDVTIGGAQPLAFTVGSLQEALASFGEATIWVPVRLGQYLEEMVHEVDGKLRTIVRDDLVIVGNFGTGGPSGSGNADDGEGWVFATSGTPDLYLSSVEVHSGIDQTTNERVARAERIVAVALAASDGTPLSAAAALAGPGLTFTSS